MTVGPADPWIITGFAFAFAGSALLIGLPLLLLGVKGRLLERPENPAVALLLMVGLFSVAVPLFVFALSWLHGFGTLAVSLLLTTGGIGLLLLLRRSRMAWPSFLAEGAPDPRAWLPFLILVAGAVFRLTPILGLYVAPADDPGLYGALTQLLLEDGGASFALGWMEPFTNPPSPYPYLFGFASLAGFHSLLLGYHPGLTVMLTTVFYASLLPLAIYALALRLFNEPVALATMALAAFVVHVPADFFSWGGNAETVGYFFAVLSLYLLWPLLTRSELPSRRSFLLPGLTLASTALVHPHAVIYVLLFLPVPLVLAAIRRNGSPWLQVGLALGVALAVLSPVLIAAWLQGDLVVPDPATVASFGEGLGGFAKVVLSWDGLSVDLLAFFLWFLPPVIVAAAAVLLVDAATGRRRGPLLAVAGWGILLLVLHGNSPVGLYLIPYPFWQYFSPPRFLYAFVALPAAVALGYLAVRIRDLFHDGGSWRKAATGFVLASLLLSVSVLQAGSLYTALQDARVNSPVAEEDVLAFRWIRQHLPQDLRFYVNDADAGPWLWQYTGRPALPNRMLMSDRQVVEDFQRLDTLLYEDPADPEALELMERYEIGAVYFGGRPVPVFSDRRQPDLDLFLRYPDTFVQVYEDRGVYIFLTDLRDLREFIVDLESPFRVTPKRVVLAVDGASVSLRGPVTVELALYRGPVEDPGNRVHVETVQIRDGETWIYTLRENTEAFPGDWNAVVRLLSLGG